MQTYITNLTEDKIACFFLGYMIIVLILNILKAFVIWAHGRSEAVNSPCEFLVKGEIEQTCRNKKYKNKFISNNNSCEGCLGRSVKQDKDDIERRAKSGVIAFWIILMANWGKAILPYAAILFTLISKISSKP